MALADTMRNAVERLRGKAKQNYGQATDDGDLEREGRGDQAKAGLKQTGEQLKKTVRDVTDN